MPRYRMLCLIAGLVLAAGCRSTPEASTPAPPVSAPAVADAPSQTPPPEPAVTPPAPTTPPPRDVRVTVEIQTAQGAWAPLPSGQTLPAGPATLRFRNSDAGQQANTLELLIRDALKGVAAEITRPDDATVQVALPALPPRILVLMPSGGDLREFVVYAGEPPRLSALDPVTAKETALGEAPVDVFGTTVAPDGRWVLYSAVDPENPWTGRYWLGSIGAGQLFPLPGLQADWENFEAWPQGRLLIAGRHSVRLWDLESSGVIEIKSGAMFWSSLSPDGRYLAGYDFGEGEVAPSSIFIVDLQMATEQVFPKMVHSLVHAHWVELPMAWAPDGKSLLIEQFLARDSRQVVRLDVASGAITPDAAPVPPAAPATVNGWAIVRTGWSVTLKGPDGQAHQFGDGYPVGWLPDGRLLVIRWPNFRYIRPLSVV